MWNKPGTSCQGNGTAKDLVAQRCVEGWDSGTGRASDGRGVFQGWPPG